MMWYLYSRSGDSAASIGGITPGEIVTQTEADLHIYVDGSTGSDANDGLTVGTPKLTLQAALDLIPIIVRHNVAVHMSGTFAAQPDNPRLSGRIVASDQGAVNIAIGGDPADLAVVDDNGGTNYTATDPETDTTKIGASGSGWTVDAFKGYLVEVLSGPAAGEIITIQRNTSDTLFTVETFATDPLVGATFRIMRPGTEWSASQRISVSGNGGTGRIFVSHLYFSHATAIQAIFASNACSTFVTGCYVESTSGAAIQFSSNFNDGTEGSYIDPATFAFTVAKRGVATNNGAISIQGSSQTQLKHSTGKDVNASNGRIFFAYGSNYKTFDLANCLDFSESFAGLNKFGGVVCRLGGNASGPALRMENCNLTFSAGSYDISSAASHAIEVDGSRLVFQGDVTGSGNAGAAVYAHSQSTVTIKDGTPPTLAGTVGDVSTDGSTEAISWATVDGGSRLADADEFVIAKEVA